MRRSTRLAGPLFVITTYYAALVVLSVWLVSNFEWMAEYFPIGGVELLSETADESFEPVYTFENPRVAPPRDMFELLIAMIGIAFLIAPLSWVYFMTTRAKEVNQSFAQTIVVLPLVVAGIAVIVANSLPLAFSLAGIVAAVRFRFSLKEPAHAIYIFAAIAIGLGAGISALGVSAVISATFVYASLILWKLDYGARLNSPFFAFLTGRGTDDDSDL